jgi:hypothetical protein
MASLIGTLLRQNRRYISASPEQRVKSSHWNTFVEVLSANSSVERLRDVLDGPAGIPFAKEIVCP